MNIQKKEYFFIYLICNILINMDQNSNSSSQLHFSKYRYTQVLHVLFLVIGGLLLLLFIFNINIYDVFAQDANNVTIKTTKLTDSLYMLEGLGGNILVSIGKDGVFMVDDQFAPLTV